MNQYPFNSTAQNVVNGSDSDGTSGILRLTLDGLQVPLSLMGNILQHSLYYAFGIRNGFGMDFDPITGVLWDTENGPGYGDEINLVPLGFNSGWNKGQGLWEPKGYYLGEHLNNLSSLSGKNKNGEYRNPELTTKNFTIGITLIKFVSSDRLGESYKNDLLVGDSKNGNIYKFKLSDDRKSLQLNGRLADKVADTKDELELNDALFGVGFGVITDIKIGPDGNVYVVSLSDGKIYKIFHIGNNLVGSNKGNKQTSNWQMSTSNNIHLQAKRIGTEEAIKTQDPVLYLKLKNEINLNETLVTKLAFLKKVLSSEDSQSNGTDYGEGASLDISQAQLNNLLEVLGDERPGWLHGVRERGEAMPIRFVASINNASSDAKVVTINSLIVVKYNAVYYLLSTTRTIFVTTEDSTVVVYPIFTGSAYQKKGFYDFYRGECGISCLRVKINDIRWRDNAYPLEVLKWLGYENVITDIDVDRDPTILSHYKTVIMLHNEYVTRTEYDAIVSHKNVIFLYPNALFAQVSYNASDGTVALVKGHRFPSNNIWNAFNWPYDNTLTEEKNHNCDNWHFRKISNGMQLNCTPNNILHYDSELWEKIKLTS